MELRSRRGIPAREDACYIGFMPEEPMLPPGADTGDLAVARILDAQGNRATEGLRVVEDYVRFVLNDRYLTEVTRQLRHDVTAALRRLGARDRLAARESEADVGALLATGGAMTREGPGDVATASFKRVQQALRSLEEYGKLRDAAMAATCEQLRFRSYTLERAVGITGDSIERLEGARLYVLIDSCASEGEFIRLAQSLVSAGVHLLQLRDKRLADRELLARARRLREITRGTGTLFIMNDRADLAVLSDADGVHVGQEELSVKDARAIVGAGKLVGVSTHSIEQGRRAVLEGTNYIGIGPTFPSTTKSFEAFTGLELLRAAAAEIALPTFAIGGITRENLRQVQAAGIHRIAVTAAVVAADDPAGAAKDFLAALNGGSG